MTTEPQLRLIDVSKRYASGNFVLDKFSLDIQKDDFVSFIGPRGCGKSTILRLIAGLAPLSGGQIEHAEGQDVRRRASFIFQKSALLPWRTVEGNVRLPLQLHGRSKDEQRIQTEETLKLFDLSHVSNRYPLQLSAGMKIRASLARGLAPRPHCLLLDEPFAALDAITRNKVCVELMRVREKRPFTGCLVTHSAAEAVFMANRVVVLKSNPGQIAKIIDVPGAYPRNLVWRESDEFQEAVNQVRSALNEVQEADKKP